jgi:acetyl-CoA decarbonylase/synthase complex subunit beta
MTFPVLAGQTGGGAQIEGFLGISIEYMRSPKFLQADGGWSRVVWMPSKLKEALKNSIPERFYDRIATEKDVANIDELLKFLQEKKRAIEIKPPEEVPAPVVSEVHPTPAAAEALTRTDLTSPAGITIVLKGVKIRAERMIIRRGEREDS